MPPLRSTLATLGSFARSEKTGGLLLLLATAIALIWANSPAHGSYAALRDFTFGPSALHLHLTLGQWAADGLLAIFFFVVGLELKQEFLVGSLRDPRAAAIPVAAAAGGVLVPALIFLLINTVSGDGVPHGWAIPTATDIAFAVSILAVVGSALPAALRAFLLTLAVVDDLIAIVIIALAYTDSISVLALVCAFALLVLFGVLVQRGMTIWWILIPLAVSVWALVHISGIHATVAGVLLAMTVPVLNPETPGRSLSQRLAWRLEPWSSALAVPVFAFFAAGVALGGTAGLQAAFRDPVTLGIIAGLVLGKPIGILLTTFTVSRLPSMSLDSTLLWRDLLGMSILAGIGFTVSLLIGELTFGAGSDRNEHVKVGVLTASLIAAVIGSLYLSVRNRSYRRRR
ncbi:Na+/H+ antiporter NhaA [Corynebacterium pacaense]|uniref:Na+/H+ antiporter NhaA n=1 Tax=Corynebacterium pacaense TaxID=1816684 RepID=UPI0009B9BA0B|nr:Na+/H+ antiporter NhaA [Corynebacterium pacaense]